MLENRITLQQPDEFLTYIRVGIIYINLLKAYFNLNLKILPHNTNKNQYK